MKNIITLMGIFFTFILYAQDSFSEKQTIMTQYFTKEAEHYITECDQGNLEACNKLGILYARGMGVKQDMAKSVELLSRACQGNISYACTTLGIQNRSVLSAKQKNAKAMEYFSQGCKLGDPRGCHMLAVMYYDGIEVEKDYSKAVKLYEQACDSEYNPLSCSGVVNICTLDNKIKQSYTELALFYGKACENGDMEGCFKLGLWYHEGIGVERNTSRAMDLYLKACEGKFARGCNEAGKTYSNSNGLGEKAKGFNLFLKASELNDAAGFRNIGLMYSKGFSVEKNYTKAKEFLKKACELKDDLGCSYYDNLSSQGY